MTGDHSLAGVAAGLFVPLSRPQLFTRAAQRGADALVFDLEDSALPAQKSDARAALPEALAALGTAAGLVVVRINADPRWLADDVRACAAAGIDFLMVPKVESSEQLRALEPFLAQMEEQMQRPPGSLRLLALIESPSGVLAAATLASASARVEALVFGAEDYAAALGIPAQAAALDWPAQQVAVAARAAGCAAWGLPGSMAGIADAASIAPLARRARAMGFTGCLCIHPAQLTPARTGFLPTAKEVAHARLVVAAAGSEQGAFVVEGRMVDAPVLAQAHATLQRAGAAAGSETSQTD